MRTTDSVRLPATGLAHDTNPNYVRTDLIRAVLESMRAVPALPSELTDDIDRCIVALSAPTFVGSGDAARLLGYASINSVKSLVARGWLSGAVRSDTGRWHLPLDSVLAARDFNRSGMRLPAATGNVFEGIQPEV